MLLLAGMEFAEAEEFGEVALRKRVGGIAGDGAAESVFSGGEIAEGG